LSQGNKENNHWKIWWCLQAVVLVELINIIINTVISESSSLLAFAADPVYTSVHPACVGA